MGQAHTKTMQEHAVASSYDNPINSQH